ncbi:MAG: hypothetical protein EA387_04430 [Nitriliruptor sp.]|nr:MAG: hypothetical protein EA387_04430 [Nitriliruptor sp.]
MRLKRDEDLPHDLAAELRRRHDVHTVADEHLAGESDPVVVVAATDEGRLLLTLDRRIGDLRRCPPGSHAGILARRPVTQDPDSILTLIGHPMRAHPLEELRGCVVVVEPHKFRIRRPERDQPS